MFLLDNKTVYVMPLDTLCLAFLKNEGTKTPKEITQYCIDYQRYFDNNKQLKTRALIEIYGDYYDLANQACKIFYVFRKPEYGYIGLQSGITRDKLLDLVLFQNGERTKDKRILSVVNIMTHNIRWLEGGEK